MIAEKFTPVGKDIYNIRFRRIVSCHMCDYLTFYPDIHDQYSIDIGIKS